MDYNGVELTQIHRTRVVEAYRGRQDHNQTVIFSVNLETKKFTKPLIEAGLIRIVRMKIFDDIIYVFTPEGVEFAKPMPSLGSL